jgi:tRNA pseudouridine38-40 synthase
LQSICGQELLDSHYTHNTFNFIMAQSSVQLVLQYDGAGFAGWQRQREGRTVQAVLEQALQRLCDTPVRVTGAGRTDAGVHARGQAAGVLTPEKWSALPLRRALNRILPQDIWVAAAYDMRADFHPRYSALARSYRYCIGTDDAARSPFRSRYEWLLDRKPDLNSLRQLSQLLPGEKSFRAFAVQGTAPGHDDHTCLVTRAEWREEGGRFVFEVEANRFLHHMVRFLVGTMVDIACGKRPQSSFSELLASADNRRVSPPAPPQGLFLEKVLYPAELYLPLSNGSEMPS